MILVEEGLRSIYYMLLMRLKISNNDSYSVLNVLTSYSYMIGVVVAALKDIELAQYHRATT